MEKPRKTRVILNNHGKIMVCKIHNFLTELKYYILENPQENCALVLNTFNLSNINAKVAELCDISKGTVIKFVQFEGDVDNSGTGRRKNKSN